MATPTLMVSGGDAGTLTANLQLLQRTAPSLAERLADLPDVDTGGRWTFANGRVVALHSRRRPIEDAQRALASLVESGYPSHLVIIGLGMGHTLDVVGQWPVPTKVLAIEPEAALVKALFSHRDCSEWLESGRLTVVAGPDYRGAVDVWNRFGATEVPPVAVHPVLAREMSADVLKARLVFDAMRFRTPLDPRLPANSQSMLHHTVLAMYEHFAATAASPILEIGAYIGGGTMAICRGIRQSGHRVPFWSVEAGGDYSTHPHLPSADIMADLRRNLRAGDLDRFVTLIQSQADDPSTVARLQRDIAPEGLSLFSIDADGQVQRDFDNFLHLCRPGCVVMVDDYSSPQENEKVIPTREAVDRLVAAGVLQSDGVHGWGTWIGRAVRPPR